MRISGGAVEARRIGFFVCELLVLAGAFLFAGAGVASLVGAGESWATLLLPACAATLTLQGGLYLADLYDPKVAWADAPRSRRLLQAVGVATIAAGLLLLLPLEVETRAAAVAGLGAACTALLAARASLRRIDRRLPLRVRLFVVGEGRAVQLLEREIAEDGTTQVAGRASPRARGLVARARAVGAEVVVVAVKERRGIDTQELLSCRLAGLEVLDAAGFLEQALRKLPVELARPSDLVFSEGFARPRWLLWARRALSVLAALALLALTAPLLLLVALLVKLDSEGPVFYAQERVGIRGRSFPMLKFRTMRTDAEASGVRWAQRDDPRVTRIGRVLRRFRIDELPQLGNVLVGHMGLVGPRPERPTFVARLRREIPFYDLRTLVPPGITGWAQIRYPYAATLEEAREKLAFDLYYVKHLSVRFDLGILFHTAKTVLFGRGAR